MNQRSGAHAPRKTRTGIPCDDLADASEVIPDPDNGEGPGPDAALEAPVAPALCSRTSIPGVWLPRGNGTSGSGGLTWPSSRLDSSTGITDSGFGVDVASVRPGCGISWWWWWRVILVLS